MDVFKLREGIVRDYQAYVKGVTVIEDARVREAVHHEFDAGLLWPDPVVQINPSFEPGPTIDELVASNSASSRLSRGRHTPTAPERIVRVLGTPSSLSDVVWPNSEGSQ